MPAHSGRASFEQDHRRQAQLDATDYDVMCFTWRQVQDRPQEVIAALRTRLSPSLPSRSS